MPRRCQAELKKTVRDSDPKKTDQEEHARSHRLKEDKFKPASTSEAGAFADEVTAAAFAPRARTRRQLPVAPRGSSLEANTTAGPSRSRRLPRSS